MSIHMEDRSISDRYMVLAWKLSSKKMFVQFFENYLDAVKCCRYSQGPLSHAQIYEREKAGSLKTAIYKEIFLPEEL